MTFREYHAVIDAAQELNDSSSESGPKEHDENFFNDDEKLQLEELMKR